MKVCLIILAIIAAFFCSIPSNACPTDVPPSSSKMQSPSVLNTPHNYWPINNPGDIFVPNEGTFKGSAIIGAQSTLSAIFKDPVVAVFAADGLRSDPILYERYLNFLFGVSELATISIVSDGENNAKVKAKKADVISIWEAIYEAACLAGIMNADQKERYLQQAYSTFLDNQGQDSYWISEIYPIPALRGGEMGSLPSQTDQVKPEVLVPFGETKGQGFPVMS
jgi:hypothetical protein